MALQAMEIDIDHLRSWIGKTQSDSETLSPRTVRQFAATFNRNWPTGPGDEAPLLIHLCLTQPIAPLSALGRDGHPELGDFLPPVSLPRRMWAGGTFELYGQIRIGETITRHSTIKDVSLKTGSTGQLCFVTVEHKITSDGRRVLSERQDIVYRDVTQAVVSKSKSTPAREGPHRQIINPTPTMLFRYSALTFNGHRIHYDKEFCTGTEGYPGLVVHGPLQATMLCQMAADIRGKPPAKFYFRSLSPLFDNMDMTINAREEGEALSLWTSCTGGPVAMEAKAEW